MLGNKYTSLTFLLLSNFLGLPTGQTSPKANRHLLLLYSIQVSLWDKGSVKRVKGAVSAGADERHQHLLYLHGMRNNDPSTAKCKVVWKLHDRKEVKYLRSLGKS